MKNILSKDFFKKKNLCLTFLILCCLHVSDTILSRKHWNRSYFQVWKIGDKFEINIKFFDYNFGPLGEHGFLSHLSCDYSRDGKQFFHLMNFSTEDQSKIGYISWLDLSVKLPGAKIQFKYCLNPPADSYWAENKNQRIEVYNWLVENMASFCCVWFLEERYKDVKHLRISGIWKVKGFWANDRIEKEVYTIGRTNQSYLSTSQCIDFEKKQVNTFVIDKIENNTVQVSKEIDVIVVKGAEPGQNIKVYTTSGALIKSLIANSEAVNIKLATNQIYIVNIGQARRRVAL